MGFLDLLEGVEVDGLFPSLVGFSDEGFGLMMVVSVLVGDLVGDFPGSVSIGGVGSFVREGGGVSVGDTDEDLGGEELREIDGDFDGEGGAV